MLWALGSRLARAEGNPSLAWTPAIAQVAEATESVALEGPTRALEALTLLELTLLELTRWVRG